MNGLVYVVRYIGVDLPQDHVNAFHAYLANSELVFRKDVRLVAAGTDKDTAGRLLRYVLVGETFVNLQLLRDGVVMATDIPGGAVCADVFKAAEQAAVTAGRGLWASPTPMPTPR
jgi:endonuclease YncB( thermonuclease family)